MLPALREHTLDLLVEDHDDTRLARKLAKQAFALFRQAGKYTRAKPEPGNRQQMRQEITHTVHQINRRLLVRHGHVHVHAEDQQRPRQLSHFFDDVFVALPRRNDLIDPARKWVRPCCRYL